jgi:hypothetical protein
MQASRPGYVCGRTAPGRRSHTGRGQRGVRSFTDERRPAPAAATAPRGRRSVTVTITPSARSSTVAGPGSQEANPFRDSEQPVVIGSVPSRPEEVVGVGDVSDFAVLPVAMPAPSTRSTDTTAVGAQSRRTWASSGAATSTVTRRSLTFRMSTPGCPRKLAEERATIAIGQSERHAPKRHRTDHPNQPFWSWHRGMPV